MAQALDCLCAGIVVADNVCQPILRMPAPGTLCLTERIEFTIGGCSANVAVDLARLGLKVGLSGRVGDDLFGREVRDRLVAAHVDASLMEISLSSSTSTTFVLNVAGEDRRFIHCVGANGEYDGSELSEDDIRRAKVLYVGGFCLLKKLTPDRVIHLFRVARDNHATTMLNVVMSDSTDTMTWLNPVLPWTDYFICNNDEAARITRETDPLRQAEALKALGAKTAVVTQGESGCILVGSDARYRVGVFPVNPVDGTGTGDAFAAGFLYGVLRGKDVRESLKMGTAMGASCVQSMGATTGVFNAAELANFLAEHTLTIEAI